MKRFLSLSILALCALAPTPAHAEEFSEPQALTRAAPTTATEGVSLLQVRGFRVAICAAVGQTLSGAGTLQAWVYQAKAQVWMRNPSLDLTISVTATSCAGAACRCQVFPDQRVPVLYAHRVLYAANAVTVSGGTVTTYITTSTASP